MAIISIQSHVSYGYVGNSAAQVVLQFLGHEVWPVHTVLFSNHPGYGSYRGDIVATETVRSILSGLLQRCSGKNCDAVLSGYLGCADTGFIVEKAMDQIRQTSSDAIYVCDPVIGDAEEGVYVESGLVDVFQKHLIPAADVITPNAFELSLLSGLAVNSVGDALRAARKLMNPEPSIVIVTSVLDADQPDHLNTLLITPDQAWAVSSPMLAHPPKGAGDLLSALWLGRYLGGEPAEQALKMAVSSVFSLIRNAGRVGEAELPLVRGRQLLREPEILMSIRSIK